MVRSEFFHCIVFLNLLPSRITIMVTCIEFIDLRRNDSDNENTTSRIV